MLFAATAFFLVWNGIAAVLVVGGHQESCGQQHPDWFLSVFVLPFLAIGIWATYYFVQQMLLHTGIGPTTVEISDHPLRPGQRYTAVPVTGGPICTLRSLELSLVCDEETTYRQGTDIRTDRCRVHADSGVCGGGFQDRAEQGVSSANANWWFPKMVMHSFRPSTTPCTGCWWHAARRSHGRRFSAVFRWSFIRPKPDSGAE